MADTVVLPSGTYPIGTRTLGPTNVPTGITQVQLALDGAQMTDPALHVEIKLDLSLDGGSTWNTPPASAVPFPVAMELVGGAKNRQGGALGQYTIGTSIPQPSNTQRRIRAIVTIAGTALTTSGVLSLT